MVGAEFDMRAFALAWREAFSRETLNEEEIGPLLIEYEAQRYWIFAELRAEAELRIPAGGIPGIPLRANARLATAGIEMVDELEPERLVFLPDWGQARARRAAVYRDQREAELDPVRIARRVGLRTWAEALGLVAADVMKAAEEVWWCRAPGSSEGPAQKRLGEAVKTRAAERFNAIAQAAGGAG